MTEMPEGYPFPDDEILYTSAYSSFNPDSDSYVSVARLPENHTVEINGRTHENTHRLVIHTPTKGPVCFLSKDRDGESLISAGLVLLSESDRDGGSEVAAIYDRYYEGKTGVDVEFRRESDE